MVRVAGVRGRQVFRATMAACVQFIVLTAIAMWVYPGGSVADPSTRGYSFFNNFFSELGLTVTRGGHPNTLSAVLFVTALTVAGIGLALFFVVVPQFFRHNRGLWMLSILGSVFGVISGLCFVGVAFTPANLLPELHGRFTLTAFQAFLVAVVFYFVAVLLHPRYPKVFAFVYLAFALLLAGYVWLMTSGPGFGTAQGVMVQATGQKAIVYAALLCMFIQGYGAQRLGMEAAK